MGIMMLSPFSKGDTLKMNAKHELNMNAECKMDMDAGSLSQIGWIPYQLAKQVGLSASYVG